MHDLHPILRPAPHVQLLNLIERLVLAAERVADALEQPRPNRVNRPNPVRVTDRDRAAARSAAHRLGLLVREEN